MSCGNYLTPEKYNLDQLQLKWQLNALWNDQEKQFIVELKKPVRPIGTVHYWLAPGKRDTIAMALKIAEPQERGKGYGTEIQKIVIMYLFEHMQAKVIEMYTDINNIAQQRCLQKLGFELVESLVYDDRQQKRTGYLFRLNIHDYLIYPFYKYNYEETWACF